MFCLTSSRRWFWSLGEKEAARELWAGKIKDTMDLETAGNLEVV